MNRSDEEALAVAERAARAAGERIRAMREAASFGIMRKEGERNLVTEADLQAEAIILEHLQREFPGDALLTEESRPSLDGGWEGPLWIVDPVDGTTNFAQGHAHVGVSIAYAVDGVVRAGVVHAPFLGETFAAVRGKGATLNGKPISCSKAARLVDALVGTGFPYDRTELDVIVERVRLVLESCRDIRRAGAASLDLCWTACGRLDVFYETLMPWDMAAGACIAREAGACVGHLAGERDGAALPPELSGDELLVAPPQLYAEMEQLLLRAPSLTR